MKAYQVFFYGEASEPGVVFAETPNKAKVKAFNNGDIFEHFYVEDSDPDLYPDLRTKRLPIIDGVENSKPEDVAYKLVKEADWEWLVDGNWVNSDSIDDPEVHQAFHDSFKNM